MTNTDSDFATIGAFIDSERVDPIALKRALASDEGRDYLVELIAMRELIAAPSAAALPHTAAPPRSSSWRGLAAAAAVTLTVGIGGYALGHITTVRRIAAEQEAANKAPAPTREIPQNAATLSDGNVGGV